VRSSGARSSFADVASSRAFISSLRNTQAGGILHVNPNPGLRYTPLLIAPASSGEPAPDKGFLTCFGDVEDDDVEDEEEDCTGACAKSASATSTIARQPQKTRRKLIPPCYATIAP
jgi:hypothetical protein